ncbi:mannan endo-1,6-alpha-mannosidase DCW1 [Colletotrichum spaethianum]|uniref:Mannan endo-1,6-alpha-mannosidase n=1 Tax=Colletotrichum spaethianum TaxID=700344 RepID=A0AA37L5F6_9PEZI|nr:mannan endo-1,6-alpha-mannosidase DCW1 [Colletotrichum spaethianum]GKT40515.1 mannan endo-1,6-alpha-mannosidase DCW1 [Colletotrichum spaethianum]
MFVSLVPALSAALLLLSNVASAAAELEINTRDNIVESSRSLAKDVMTFYHGEEPGNIPGILPGPPTFDNGDYWWYQGASLWATYLDYWHLIGDDSYADTTSKGMLHQTGPNNDYMPPNFTASLGNDDQCFWGTAALTAAEYDFPNVNGKATWIDLAKAVWNTQASPDRQDETCNGGLRWQVPWSNAGYEYKQIRRTMTELIAAASNACFFNMGARLARFTGNTTYSEWAEKTWDWLSGVGLIDSETWAVYDGTHVETNCTEVNKVQWSYNAAMLIQGAAFMYNNTNGSEIWRERVEKLSGSLLTTFFPNGTAYEVACERHKGVCPHDALWYKGYVHRWLSSATQLAPFIADKVLPILKSSTEAAVKQCVAGKSGLANQCGFYWTDGVFSDPQTTDNTTGAGEAVSVLAAVSNLLISDANVPVTEADSKSGDLDGNSQGSSPSGTPVTTSPTGKTTPSGAESIRFDMKMSILIGSLLAVGWAM